MVSKDVLDQIRDLQSFIDDFVADAAGVISPTTLISPFEEKTELAEPLTKETILQKPDEKTQVELETQQTEAANVTEIEEAKEKQDKVDEKVLVEATAAPLTILSYDLNLSDDFSSLLTQFKEIKVSPTDVDLFKKQQQQQQQQSDQEKIQVDVAPDITTTVWVVPSSTPKLSNKSFLLSDNHSPCHIKSSRSRRTSISSKKSQRSSKSSKSAKSARSARKLQTEKKLQQQQQQQQQQQSQQAHSYVERSYDEMMRIPDIYERVAFYEKTLDLCLKAHSPISNWCKKNKEKGKPQPLLEGYVPPIRLLSPEKPLSENTFGNMSTTFSGSISMFLKKAGGGGVAGGGGGGGGGIGVGSQFMSHKKVLDNKSFLVASSSSYTPQTPSLTSSSGLFGRSISRLNLSRSTQIPRYDNNMKTPVTARLTPLANRVTSSSASIIPSTPRKKRSSINTMNKALTPLNMDYSHRNSSMTPKSSTSTPSSFGSTTTINSQGEFTSQSSALNYMVNILPQIDVRILQNALEEAKGDRMVAISIAVSQNKLATSSYVDELRASGSKKSASGTAARHSRHYKVK